MLVNKGYKSFDSVSFSFESVGYFGANIRLFWNKQEKNAIFFSLEGNNFVENE